MISLDAGLQEALDASTRRRQPLHPEIHRRRRRRRPRSAALRETAKLLVNAQNPVIVADRVARTPTGIKHLVELAELLQAPVVDQGGRMNFPNTHHLDQRRRRQLMPQRRLDPRPRAHRLLGRRQRLHRQRRATTASASASRRHQARHQARSPSTASSSTTSPTTRTSSASSRSTSRWSGDAEASLPSLIEAVKQAITDDRKAAFEKRGEALQEGACRSARAHHGGSGGRLGRDARSAPPG